MNDTKNGRLFTSGNRSFFETAIASMGKILMYIIVFFVISSSSSSLAGSDSAKYSIPAIMYLLLSDDSIPPWIHLNDTGINRGADFPVGKNNSCSSNIFAAQDCHQGRDVFVRNQEDGFAGFSFTKLDELGNALAGTARKWSCVRDNVTGLVWEVKTDDGGIHDKDLLYRWGGKTALGEGFGKYYNDWDELVDGTIEEKFCGYSQWRVPTYFELFNLASLSTPGPTMDKGYFPHTESEMFWTASPAAWYSESFAWGISFQEGLAFNQSRLMPNRLRLVADH